MRLRVEWISCEDALWRRAIGFRGACDSVSPSLITASLMRFASIESRNPLPWKYSRSSDDVSVSGSTGGSSDRVDDSCESACVDSSPSVTTLYKSEAASMEEEELQEE